MTAHPSTPVPPHLSDEERALWEKLENNLRWLVNVATEGAFAEAAKEDARAQHYFAERVPLHQNHIRALFTELLTRTVNMAEVPTLPKGARRLWCRRCEAHYVGAPPKNWCPRCDGERLPAHSLPHPLPSPPSDAGTSERETLHHIWCKALLKMDLPCDCRPAAALPGAAGGTPTIEKLLTDYGNACRLDGKGDDALDSAEKKRRVLTHVAALTSEVARLTEANATLSDFARTAPGRLPQHVQDALSPWRAARLASPSPTGAP